MKKIIKGFTATLVCLLLHQTITLASSHREAPLIADDPLADNTDLYAFRSTCDASKIVLIANYIPFEHPAGGPNWYTFGEDIRYEIHVDNNTATPGDDIIYRFTFKHENQDPTTFFRIRLGKENWKTTYMLERSMNGGASFTTIITNGVVPPPNIGPRSIESPVGLGSTDPSKNNTYEALMTSAITVSSTGEKVFAGPIDDPFFADLGGIFDLGNFRKEGQARDALAKFNCHSLVVEVPISTLQKNGKSEAEITSILDPEYVIGVWASASRREVTTLDPMGGKPSVSGGWVQVSRLGMPLTNEVIIPIGKKDFWNTVMPGKGMEGVFNEHFFNPELALYMDDSKFGTAVPGLADLRIQTNSLGAFDFRNGMPGLFPLKNSPALEGTALAESAFGSILLPDNKSPRSVDLYPLFYFGVPNLPPYQLANQKPAGNPLAAGKPFINNFLPSNGDMLRLNMAVPATTRTDPDFSSLGLLKAAVLGLTDERFNQTNALQAIPNMDGFPNGRRLEDDVVTIELQAVGGVVLAAIGLWYDDYVVGESPVTPQLVKTISFNAGVTKNDTTFQQCFPFVQTPWRGFTGESYVGPKSVQDKTGCETLTLLNTLPIVGNATCGMNDGQISIIPTSGTGPFMYSIDGGATYVSGPNGGYTFFNLPAGTYQLMFKNEAGCASAMVERMVSSINCPGEAGRMAISTYPNPSNGQFRLQVQNAADAKAEVTIMDAKGTIIQRRVMNLAKANNNQFNLTGRGAGMYYIKVVSGNQTITHKILLNK